MCREGTINAKGKGEMQTYWLEPAKTRTAITGSSGGIDESGRGIDRSARSSGQISRAFSAESERVGTAAESIDYITKA